MLHFFWLNNETNGFLGLREKNEPFNLKNQNVDIFSRKLLLVFSQYSRYLTSYKIKNCVMLMSVTGEGAKPGGNFSVIVLTLTLLY